MAKYLLFFLIAFCSCLVITPLVRRLALFLGAVDRPGERKIHSVPIARLGGLSIVIATTVALLIAAILGRTSDLVIPIHMAGLLPVLAGGAIVFVGGIWDDICPVSKWTKFMFQSIAALIAIALGVLIERVSLFGAGAVELGILAIPLTFLWIVGITNAFNLLDGLDGLAAGLASIAAGTCAAIFLLRGDAQDALLLVILLGALLGFLKYNFNPATMFLGDSGSLFVGYVLAVTAISGSQKGATALAVLIPLLVFGLPILDTLLSMVRRFLGGLKLLGRYKAPLKERVWAAKRMFEADQGHIHHRLIALGFSHRNAVLVLYGVALAFSLMAVLSVFAQYRNAGIILITVALATYVGVRKLGYEEITFLRTGTLLRWYDQLSFSRLFFLGFLDIVLITAAYWGSFVIKYDLHWSPDTKAWFLSNFPLVLMIQLGTFTALGLYKGVWRAAGVGDLVRLSLTVALSVALSYIVVEAVGIPPAGTLPFFCIDLLLLGALVLGSRCTYRVLDYADQRENLNGIGVLIYGAGRGGQLVLQELLQNPQLGLSPLGFIDDAPILKGRSVNRMPVLGSSGDLVSILESHPVSSIGISSDKINGDRLDRIINVCRERNIMVLHGRLQFEPVESNGSLASNIHSLDVEEVVETGKTGGSGRVHRDDRAGM